MPLVVTHVLVPIIFLELIRDNWKTRKFKASKFFSKRHIFLIGLAGLLPDLDVPIYRALALVDKSISIVDMGHRVIFHNLWIPLGFLGFFVLFYYILPKLWELKKNKAQKLKSFGKVFLVLLIGFSIHLMLDAVLTGHVMPFYPLGNYLVNWDFVGRAACATGIPGLTILVSMDALLLIFWLWHEEMGHRIKDYF